MEKEMFGVLFKYEDNMLFKKRKGGKKWTCCNELKPNNYGYIEINENKLDNRIENLRVVNSSENNQNRTHCKGKPIKGVYFSKKKNTWQSQWCENKKQKNKWFKTEAEALEYRAKMVELHYSHHPSKR